jgi:hypothetical protein
MASITLNSALKIKNRLAERLKKVDQQIEKYNSIRVGINRPVDMDDLFIKRGAIVRDLINIKTAIAKANNPLWLFEIAELKAEISLISGLSTIDGKIVNDSYHRKEGDPDMIEYTAFLNEGRVQEDIEDLQRELDTFQDRIDKHNATTTIEVELDYEL